MGLQIESGTGNGKLAKVDDYNRLLTLSVAATPEHFANHDIGRAWSTSFTQTVGASGSCFYYLKNNSPNYELVVEGLDIAVDRACEIYFQIGDTGTPGGSPTTITAVNNNSGSGIALNGTIYRDDAMSGLSGGSEFYRRKFIAAVGTTPINFELDIILKQNGVMTIWSNTASVQIVSTVWMFNGLQS